jgi:hypothetical protein
MALATTNLDKLLGINSGDDMVAYQGGDMLGMESKVIGVVSPGRSIVDLF